MVRKGQMRGVEKGDILGQVASSLACSEWPPKLNKRWDFTLLAFVPDFLQHNRF